jgi:hypothetical protein
MKVCGWNPIGRLLLAVILTCSTAGGVRAQDDSQELAKQLSNPVASLISVPLQFNYDEGFGPNDGERVTLNIQPVIPISLNDNWTMISRTIMPVIWQNDIAGPSGEQSGLGDITQSLFFAPANPGPSGIIFGVGPVFLVPTGTDDLLGGGKWGAGPTAVVLKQMDGWTIGALANHIWSFEGDGDRADVSSTFLQPFVSYTTADAWTFGVNLESTFNWETEDWSVPVNVTVAKLTKFGHQPVSFTAGIRYWAESPESGPDGLGFRGVATFLFPK